MYTTELDSRDADSSNVGATIRDTSGRTLAHIYDSGLLDFFETMPDPEDFEESAEWLRELIAETQSGLQYLQDLANRVESTLNEFPDRWRDYVERQYPGPSSPFIQFNELLTAIDQMKSDFDSDARRFEWRTGATDPRPDTARGVPSKGTVATLPGTGPAETMESAIASTIPGHPCNPNSDDSAT